MHLPRSFIGIFLTLLTIIFAVAAGLMVKKIGDQAALVTVLMYRFLLSTPLLALMAFLTRGRRFLQINARRTLMVRIVFGCVTMACWFASIRLLPLGQATALLQSSVIFVTLLSPLLLGEVIGVWRWGAVVTGMFGIVLLTNPFDGGFSTNVIYGVAGAVSGAGLSILLRRLGKADHPFSTAVWYNGTGAVLLTSLAFILPGDIMLVTRPVMIDLVILGVVAAALQLSITSAYRYAEAVVIASMRYLQIPAAGLVAYLVFAEVMTITEIAGGVVVIASCLVIAWREMVRSRRLSAEDVASS
ncbi:MAG: DMT family transporter [Candidatus Puniceispirillaceae bacterium]